MISHIKKLLIIFSLTISFVGLPLGAETINIDVNRLLPHTELSFSPRSGSFVEGSTFQVPILLNTKGKSINGIEVRINFDKDKLMIINPSSGTSIIGVWVEPPAYDNTKGTASYVGVVPNGIVTDSGLVGMVTFKAKATGRAIISVSTNSKILLNDGLGTETILDLVRAEYTIIPKAPEGVIIFSETHPIQENWYNNNNPSLYWDRDLGVTGFSFVLDDKPATVPENTIITNDTIKSFEKLNDGLHYFHIKAYKNGVWGNTGHFLLRVDTAPPAVFTPQVNYVLAAVQLSQRALVSFFTTDNLSGVDHYEVGVIDKTQPVTVSPAFVQTESPYQVTASNKTGLQVIVRAVDKAGNVRDSSTFVQVPFAITKYLKDNLNYILLAIILIILLALIFHYLFGHHILRHMRRAFQIAEEEERASPRLVDLPKMRQVPPQMEKIFEPPVQRPTMLERLVEAPEPKPSVIEQVLQGPRDVPREFPKENPIRNIVEESPKEILQELPQEVPLPIIKKTPEKLLEQLEKIENPAKAITEEPVSTANAIPEKKIERANVSGDITGERTIQEIIPDLSQPKNNTELNQIASPPKKWPW